MSFTRKKKFLPLQLIMICWNCECLPFCDTSRHKYRSIFVTYLLPKRIKWRLCH